jgi:tellurite methyltransferase
MAEPVRAPSDELRSSFGDIDIYLFDQLLKGNFDERRRVLDAGCGHGRNLVFFLRNDFECYAVDRDAAALAATRRLARSLAPSLPDDHFRVGTIERLPWADGSMDAVICSAVLHFVVDEEQFARGVEEMWRMLAPEGLLFARLASSIGLEPSLRATRGVVRLPDGSDRFVVDERLLLETTARLGARLVDPIKTTNVQGVRCMTTWTIRK